jgi:serine/threonine-protein kinase
MNPELREGEMLGRVLGGRYRLTALLGRGGMGEVWAAHDERLGRDVAVKLLQGHVRSRGDVERFLREARIAERLSHRNIVTIHDFGEDSAAPYLVMELLDGRDLAAVSHDGPQPVREVLKWGEQIAAGLAAAHAAGIPHHDLKPANVQLTADGLAKILDVGLARYATVTTQGTAIVGAIAYMAPERARGEVGDDRSDLYSLGCMLAELLTGGPPFPGDDPVAIMLAHLREPPALAALNRPDVPLALRDLILRLLAKRPEERPGGAHIVQEELQGIAATLAASA